MIAAVRGVEAAAVNAVDAVSVERLGSGGVAAVAVVAVPRAADGVVVLLLGESLMAMVVITRERTVARSDSPHRRSVPSVSSLASLVHSELSPAVI